MKKKIGTALLALLISFGLWLYVISVVSPESEQTYYNIPVVFNGANILEGRGLMMTSSNDVKVNLTLSGTRTDLNKLNSSNITIIADLSGITSAGEHVIHYSISYPGSASDGGFKVLDQKPQQITVQVKAWAKKDIPVEVDFVGEVPSMDYIVDRQNVHLDHSSVTVSGPREIVDQIDKAMITVDLTNRTANFTEAYEMLLCDDQGNAIEGADQVSKSIDAVKAKVKISMMKTVQIVVNVIPGSGLTADDISYMLNHTSIAVSGQESLLKDLNEIVLTLDLSQENRKVISYDIVLPEGVTNISGVRRVEMVLTIPELITKVITITEDQFESIHVPEHLTPVFVTQQLEIEFRGRENHLAELTLDNIHVKIDFENAVEGSGEYKVTIQLVGAKDVGVIGEYYVTVTLINQDQANNTP